MNFIAPITNMKDAQCQLEMLKFIYKFNDSIFFSDLFVYNLCYSEINEYLKILVKLLNHGNSLPVYVR